MISSLEQVIKTIEEEMSIIIESSKVLSRQMELLTSIDGIGRIVVMNMLLLQKLSHASKILASSAVMPVWLRLPILPEVANIPSARCHREPVNI